MENNTLEVIKQFQKQVKSEHIELIDFDNILLTMQTVEKTLSSYEQTVNDLQLLKDNLAAKIIGMEKAITAVTNNKEMIAETMHLIEYLPRLNAELLLKQHSRTVARFHDAFPTTFEQAQNIAKRKMHYEDYK